MSQTLTERFHNRFIHSRPQIDQPQPRISRITTCPYCGHRTTVYQHEYKNEYGQTPIPNHYCNTCWCYSIIESAALTLRHFTKSELQKWDTIAIQRRKEGVNMIALIRGKNRKTKEVA